MSRYDQIIHQIIQQTTPRERGFKYVFWNANAGPWTVLMQMVDIFGPCSTSYWKDDSRYRWLFFPAGYSTLCAFRNYTDAVEFKLRFYSSGTETVVFGDK